MPNNNTYGHNRRYPLTTTKKPYKKTVHGLISILTGPEEDAEIIDTYYVSDRSMAEAIDYSHGLDVFEDKISADDKKVKMPDGIQTIPHLFVEEKLIPTFVNKSRSVACCAYNATNEFMKHWLGRQLDRHDNEWYKLNSLVTGHGLPQASSFTVIQQLIEPYNAAISRIIVPKNSRRFPEHKPFMLSLGANPFFMSDGKTTNEEAYGMLFPEQVLQAMKLDAAGRAEHKSQQFDQWRFECDEQPFRCLLYTSPSPRDRTRTRMPSSA